MFNITVLKYIFDVEISNNLRIFDSKVLKYNLIYFLKCKLMNSIYSCKGINVTQLKEEEKNIILTTQQCSKFYVQYNYHRRLHSWYGR